MAKPYKHKKGFLIIQMDWDEARSIGFGIPNEGCICMFCNSAEKEKIYYVAALNETSCTKCLQDFLESSKWYAEDADIEQRNFDFYAKALGIEAVTPVEFKVLTEEGPA